MERTFLPTAALTTGRFPLLRRAILLDAAASGLLGVAMALAATPLADLLGLPTGLLRWAGAALLPFALLLGALGSREHPPRPAASAVVAVNLLWIGGSVLLLVAGRVDPTPLGTAFVVVQATAVACFATLQATGLRRAAASA